MNKEFQLFNINKLIEKTYFVNDELNRKQIEREEEVGMLLVSFFAKKNLLFVGEPGVSKTGLLKIFATILSDGKVFKCTIKDDSKYEELFGDRYFDESGKMHYDTSSSMIDSNIAILDEIWKGNSKILNSLLSAMSNYRVVEIRGIGEYRIPNISTFGASNELPTDPSLDALDDRFNVRMVVRAIKSNDNWLNFISGNYDKSTHLRNTFTLDEVEFVNRMALQTTIGIDIFEMMLRIKNKIKSLNIHCSDRRFDGSVELLQVSAFLNGRDCVNLSDIFLLIHMLWKIETDIEKIKHIIYEEIFGVLEEVKQVILYQNNNLVKLQGIKDGRLRDFLKFRNSFENANMDIFDKYINELQALLNEFKKTLNGFTSVVRHYNGVEEIEEMILNNRFLFNHSNHIYEHVNIQTVFDNINIVQKEINSIEKWLSNYSTPFNYNMEVSKKK